VGTSLRSFAHPTAACSAHTAAANHPANAISSVNHEMTSLQQKVKIKLN
jgi:hypothetical protein